MPALLDGGASQFSDRGFGGALRRWRQREIETGSFARLRLHPDAAAVAFHNALANGQSYPCTRIRLAVEALENSEDLRAVLRLNADAVVFHAEQPSGVASGGGHVDPWGIRPPVFYGIADQVLQEL